MVSSLKQFSALSRLPILVLDNAITLDQYCLLNLSTSNPVLQNIDITNPIGCQKYINSVLEMNGDQVAYGGYLEKRGIYKDKANFSNKGTLRTIHLGVDFWAKAGTKVIVPLEGKVHSFQNNTALGDYGPTIILQHELNGFTFHTLYGHLSLNSIATISLGQKFERGDVLGELGTPDINVNYAPHLHFQIIIDMEGRKGDYPGVCTEKTLEFYSKNCPDPNFLLQIA